MEGRKEGKARGEARLGRAVSRARQRGNELNGDQKERFEWRGAMECRDFIRRRLDKTFPVARAEIEKEVCTCPLSLENERFSPSSSSFFFAALSLSLSPADQNSFPFRSHGSSSFSTQLSFSIYSLPPSSPPTRFLARARHNATISVRPRRKRRKSLNASWTSGAAYQRRTVLTRRRGSVKSGAENNKSDNEFPTLLPILWLQRFYLQYILVCTYTYYMCIR